MLNLYTTLKALSITERKVLYFYAIETDYHATSHASNFRATFVMSDREYERTKKQLLDKGLLTSYGYYYFGYSIRDEFRLGVMAYLIQFEPTYIPKLTDIFRYSTECILNLRIMEYVLGHSSFSPKGTLNQNVGKLAWCYFDEPWLDKLIPFVAEDDFCDAVASGVRCNNLYGTLLSRQCLDLLCSAPLRNEINKQKVLDHITYYRFVAYGDLSQATLTTRMPWTLTAEAIRQVTQGKYEAAIECFTAALKILNRDTSLKNCYFDVFAQYYLVMAYFHLDNEVARKKLTQYLKKKDVDSYLVMLPGTFMARVFLDGKKILQTDPVKRMIENRVTGDARNNLYYMGCLFDRYYGMGYFPAGITSVPTFALMRFELSKFLTLTDQERADLQAIYGEYPALTSIERKEVWELVLDEALKAIDQVAPQNGAPASAPVQSARIIYVRTHGDYFEPKLQTVLKSGAWSKPKNVAKERFWAGEVEGMDDNDRMVAKIMQPDTYYYSYDDNNSLARSIMPYLIGSDRVFDINSYSNEIMHQIQVMEGDLYVKVAKDNVGRYQVSSNLTLDHLNHLTKGMATLRTDAETYTVVAVSDSQKRILEILLKDPVFPAKAEQLLMKLLTRLDGVVEIKSPLLDKSAVKTLDGSDLIVLKVKPMPGMQYDVAIMSKPLEHGTVYMLPGTGKAVYYDTLNGANVRVKRDLTAESATYHEVIDLIDSPEYPMGEGDYNVTLDIEPLLGLIDFSRLNPDKVVMEWADGKGLALRTPLSQGSWNVGLKSQNGWFDIEGEVRVDEHTVIKMSELIDIIAREKGRFVRLGEGDYIEIDRKLRRQLERIEALAVRNRNKLQVSAFNAALLDQSVLDGEIHIAHDEKLTELQQRIRQSEEVTPTVPSTLQATLRPYQVEGYQWMMRLAEWGAGACLADDMGLGKTVQTIAFLLAKAKEGPALIVAPASVVPNWGNELARFAPSLRVEILNRADDRNATIKGARKGAVILTTYGLLNTMEEALSKKKWTTVCLDEAHTIKNRDTKMSQAAMKLQATYRIALTGTPIQNHLGELWNLFRFLNEGLLGPFDSFRQKFVNPISQNNDKERRRALQRIIKPFMLRRTKSEVVDELPDKTDIYLPVELSDEEMAMYEALRQKAVKALEEATTLDVSTLAEITKLRQAACAPSLIDKDWTGANSKVQAFLELVRDFKGEGNKMLVFSQFTSFLDVVRKALDAEGEKYLYLDGSTPMKQRERLVEEFQHGECPLFLISLKAGGLGLNLTGANYVVHLDPWWNPAIEQQATDRAYRIGQHRNVTVYHLLSKGTIEEKIRRLHQTKRDLADSLLEGTDMAGRLSLADILDLINS